MQRRIVARIDALFAEIEEGEQALAEARAGVETYRKALLKAAVTGELTASWRQANPTKETAKDLVGNLPAAHRRSRSEAHSSVAETIVGLPEEWCWTKLSALGDFGRGKSKHRPRNDPKLFGGPYPFIQTGVIAASNGRIEVFDQTYSGAGLSQSKLWPKGTVCITIAANIAKSGVLAFDACFPDSVVGLSCFDGIIPEYIEMFIRTAREQLELYAPATAQKNINLETLYALAIPLPPTEEQREIVKMTQHDDGLAEIDEICVQPITSTLKQSILASAFRGDLSA